MLSYSKLIIWVKDKFDMAKHVFVLDQKIQEDLLEEEVAMAPDGFLTTEEGKDVVTTMTIMNVYNIAAEKNIYISGSKVTMCPNTHVLVVETDSSALIDVLRERLTFKDEFACKNKIIPFALHSRRGSTKKVSL